MLGYDADDEVEEPPRESRIILERRNALIPPVELEASVVELLQVPLFLTHGCSRPIIHLLGIVTRKQRLVV